MLKSSSKAMAIALIVSVSAPTALNAQGAGMAVPTFDIPNVEKPGDDALTCDQIQAEIQQLDGEMAGSGAAMEAMAKGQQAGMVAKEKAGSMAKQALTGLASSLLPGVGGLLGAGVGALTSAATKKANSSAGVMAAMQPMVEQQVYISERKRHLEMLSVDKCAGQASTSKSAK